MADAYPPLTPAAAAVAPVGAALAAGGVGAVARARASLGPLLGLLPDSVLLAALAALDDGADVARFACASRGCWALASVQEVWRGLTLARYGGDWAWAGTWARTYAVRRRRAQAAVDKEAPCSSPPTQKRRRLPPPHPLAQQTHADAAAALAVARRPHPRLNYALPSDDAYAPWAVASLDAAREGWLTRDTLPRVPAASLTAADFIARYDAPGMPVLLEGALAGAPCMDGWTDAALSRRLTTVHAGGVDLPWSTYAAYAATTTDDAPLTVFDSAVLDTAGLAADAPRPACAPPDLFQLLPPPARPDASWLIVGPAGSGSTMHVDPNGTSAWNGVVRGAKKWVLFPPGPPPPGIHPSPDGAHVAGPATVRDWFASFYEEAVRGPPGRRPVEGVARAGDVVFVPRHWWHAVLNLESPTIAVTTNFASPAGLAAVLAQLRTRRADLVSGVRGAAAREALVDAFEAALARGAPAELAAANDALNKARPRAGVARLFDGGDGGGFSFGFSVGQGEREH